MWQRFLGVLLIVISPFGHKKIVSNANEIQVRNVSFSKTHYNT